MNATSLDTLWPIFIAPSPAFSNGSDQLASPMTLTDAKDTDSSVPPDSGPSVMSRGATGLYRVRYTSNELEQLAAQLRSLDVGPGDDLSSEQIGALLEASALVRPACSLKTVARL